VTAAKINLLTHVYFPAPDCKERTQTLNCENPKSQLHIGWPENIRPGPCTLPVLWSSFARKAQLLGSRDWRSIARANFGSGCPQWMRHEWFVGGKWCRVSPQALSVVVSAPFLRPGSLDWHWRSADFSSPLLTPPRKFPPAPFPKRTNPSTAQRSATPAINSEPALPRSSVLNAIRKLRTASPRRRAITRFWE
jgi:hypothetical protein